jgi:plastocyanin
MRRVAGVFALAVFAVLGFGAAVFATGSGATPTAAAATSRVTVVGTEFKFTLSKRSVPTGTVIFTFRNRGKIAHNFKIAGKKTPILAPGKSSTLKVKISKRGRFAYLCTLAGHAQAGMKGVLVVGTTTPPPTTATTTTTTTTTTTPTTTTVPGPATTIQVGMFEYRFDLSQTTVPSGTVTFVITNMGSEPHNFDIAGVRAGAILGPGQTETWTVGLAPRTYITVCDVPFHVDRGMTGNLTVT